MDKLWLDWHNLDKQKNKGKISYVQYCEHINYTSERHMHEYWEINIVTHGTGVHYVDSREYACSEGDVYIIPPFTSHQYISSGNLNVHNIMLSDIWMQHYMADCNTLPCFHYLFSPIPIITSTGEHSLMFRLHRPDFQTLSDLLHIYNVQPSKNLNDQMSACHQLMLAANSFTIVSFLCRLYIAYGKYNPSEHRSANSNAFAKSLHYIHQHYNEKISVEDLAREAAMSYSTYNRIFRKNLNCSPLEYISSYRISASKYFLRKGFSVAEVANMTGFFDHSHFIKTFSKHTGITPADYRKSPSSSGENDSLFKPIVGN